ncbi:MAG: AAA family ATPase, partial [Myxococcota bacterium]
MSVHTFGEYELDRSLYELRRSGAPIDVGPRIFDVLAYLIDHRDRLVSKEELVREVWDATAMSGSSVPTCIAAIRKLLGDDPAKPEFIETLRGRGYRFIAPVTRTTSRYANGIGGADPDALQRSRDVSRPIFVGRESEIASLYAAFEHALAGTPQLVLVAGEAGIGKTRLLEELAPAVRDDGATVLHGRCIEGGGAPAFWPWVQIIRSYTDTPGLPSIPEALGSLAPSLLRMVPEIADRFPNVPAESTEDSDQARFRLYDAVSLLLNRAAVERPLVLLIDDLHRADTASLLLLRFAAREMRDAPILIVGAYREIELQSDNVRSEILSDLTREESTRCIQLHGLTADAVSRLIANSSPSGSPSQSLSIAMHEQTAGNPFFVTQIIHLLAADGRLDDMDEKIEWRFRLPSGIREAVTRQLDGLPEETIRTLSVAAIAGREFSIRVISPALDESVETTLGTLQPVLDSNLITPLPGQVDRYRFAHVLLRDCIYESLPATERIHLHHQIAESLERLHNGNLDPHAAELAYHFSEAIPSTPSN